MSALDKLQAKTKKQATPIKKVVDNNKAIENKKTVAPGQKDSSLSKDIRDIEISLIDTDELNEDLYGYEDLNKIEQSFEVVGNKSIIYVYKRANGRFLCYAGNQRLIVSKKRGDKTITCIVEGDEPSEEERIEHLIFMNSQRTPRPYYTARQLSEYERLIRRKGERNIVEAIQEKFGYKESAQRKYKQILKLSPELQNLFKRDDVPFVELISLCNKIPEEKCEEFASAFRLRFAEEEPKIDQIKELYNSLFAAEGKEKDKILKTNKMYKELLSLPYYTEEIKIPPKKKDLIYKQAKSMRDYLDRIIEACN